MSKNSKQPKFCPERVSGIQSPKDRREALETITRAFTRPEWMERHMAKCVWQGSIASPEHTRIAVADGRVVSAVAMGPRMMRFGPVAVPAMTIGPVGTHDQFRKQGYSFAAMNDASNWMRDNGILIGYLQGIPDYYYRYGYYPYMTPTRVKLQRENMRKQAAAMKLRAMTRADIPAVAAFYEKAMANRICTALRSRELWQWLLGPGRKTWFFHNPKLIFDASGKLAGYFTNASKDQLDIKEIVVRADESACRAALGALVAEARRREIKELSFPIGWIDPLAVFTRQQVPAEFSVYSNPTGGSVMKIVDFPRLMKALEPLFTQRWRESHTALGPIQFSMECELGAVGIAVAKDAVQVLEAVKGPRVRVPQRWLSGLLTGYSTLDDIAGRDGVSVPGKLKPVMDVLFPRDWPWVHQADNY